MKTNTKPSRQAPTPQTVTGSIKLKLGARTIQIQPTAQKLSAHAGQVAFAAFMDRARWRETLAGLLPQRPTSPNALQPVEMALGFMAGVLAGADKLTRVAWLRGDPVLPEVHCANNVLGFTETLLANPPPHVSLRLIRADSGFQNDAWLSLLEARALRYLVVADLSVRVKSCIRKETRWQPTGMEGVDVAEEIYTGKYASRPRRLVILRRRCDAPGRGGGKLLFDGPGYQYQALLTNLGPDVTALEIWRDYNGRAQMENVIKELKHGFGLAGFCCQKFFATEAAMSLAALTYNLYQLFCEQAGLRDHATIATARYRLFHCAGVLSRAHGRTLLKLSIPPPLRAWWESLWTHLSSA